jgi:hypothetical protein
MTLLKQANKGPHMNSIEQFYIQLYAHNKKLEPEQIPGEFNPYSGLFITFRVVTLRDFDLYIPLLEHSTVSKPPATQQ